MKYCLFDENDNSLHELGNYNMTEVSSEKAENYVKAAKIAKAAHKGQKDKGEGGRAPFRKPFKTAAIDHNVPFNFTDNFFKRSDKLLGTGLYYNGFISDCTENFHCIAGLLRKIPGIEIQRDISLGKILSPETSSGDRVSHIRAKLPVGGAAVGILYTALPITTLFLIVGVCYLISGVSKMFIRYEYTPPKDRLTLQTVLSDMEEGYRYLRSRKAVIVLMIAALFINFFITPLFGNFVPYFIKTDLISSPAYLFDSFMKPELWSSVLSMLVGISSLLGALLMTMKEEQGKYGMKIAIRFCAMALTVSVMAAAYWLLVARGVSLNLFLILCSLCAFSIGFIIPLVNIPINTLMMRIIDRSQLSKVNGMISIVSQALIPLASVLAGSVLQIWGSSVLLFFCAVGLTVSAVYFLLQPETRTF